jgi:hypothetical protein
VSFSVVGIHVLCERKNGLDVTGARIRLVQHIIKLAGREFSQGLDEVVGRKDIEACVRKE